MSIKDFVQNLTEEQKSQFEKLSKAEERLAFAKQLGFDLDEESLLSVLKELPDQDLENVSGGRKIARPDIRMPTLD
ncbi:Nif11-like leader peptide family RiPP precursor [Scatolibacter rhodanostii]|uniref:Nif11-like leader peptide family RiPP precursor n=1 Tax=Scatolibacter rhodanostii TaxID=2014781 RepID=UPI000C08A1A4|nr:Nif11-like leader peptide family RiPP precursor [Scatolibacter rhodanostii]